MIGRSACARAAVLMLATMLVAACQPQQTTPSPSPTTTVEPTATRPRFELATYEYALQTKGKIRVAVMENAAPLSSHSHVGTTYEGFEPDIAREIARQIWGPSDDPDTHIDWISVDASTRVSALTSNQADLTLAALVTSDELKNTIDLSDTYLRTGQRLVVKKTNDQIKDLADVADGEDTVCALRGSAAVDDLRKITNNGAKVLTLDTMEFCQQALASGAADAITADETTLLTLVTSDPTLRIVVKPFTDQRLAIGMKKTAAGDRTGFVEFVNGALLKIVADRTWARLYTKDLMPLTGDTKQIPTD